MLLKFWEQIVEGELLGFGGDSGTSTQSPSISWGQRRNWATGKLGVAQLQWLTLSLLQQVYKVGSTQSGVCSAGSAGCG